MNELHKKQLMLISLILFQLFSNVLLVSYNSGWTMFNYFFFFPEISMFLNLFLAAVSIYLIKQIFGLTRKEFLLKELERQNTYNEKLSTIIRTIKHDIANQITVIDGMYQLGKRREALEYTKILTKDFDWIEQVLELDHPEVASLIINKVTEANNLGVKTKVEIHNEKVNLYFNVETVTRILGNLIDNALYALKNQDQGIKFLNIKIIEVAGKLILEVENSGEINPEIHSRIFEQGFTTKGDQGNGLGLYIVKSLVTANCGSIDFLSENGSTKFKIEISCRVKQSA